jgi:hypothetical protein
VTGATERFVILGIGAYPSGAVAAALRRAGGVIIDETANRALLVSAGPTAVATVSKSFPRISVTKERSFGPPQ